ncbi:MAG: DUF3078 domain-containing protein [Candidatus Latescibacteria bacterium]|nr:DUF3078 domain-containing protein [Candidatus Latescibacterota bacterium]NIM21977.1 DUF3078 domain-containing protein [Candidatus Latescibacterota bacterium]NIM65995.1 DUF3078 domain-containing protein [Candidatus Latescibacterota bacterium]NIO02403.1 DUF3078 domain-containing protein [Candidatus Latescibacterota bacterium]NIO29313.1 DUF3078 domain-containing protein [Candidatus Latescibacterota bacterium]
MKTLVLLLSFSVIMTSSMDAAAEDWNLSADLNLTLAQNAYSDNWVGGESGSLTWQFNSNTLAEKQLNNWIHNKNTLKLLFGQTHNQDPDTKKWLSPVKSTDLIDLESTFRFTLGGFVDPILALRVITQFIDQSDPAKDRWLNPLDITETLGIAKVFIKDEKREWMARLGAGFRELIYRDVLDPDTGTRDTETATIGGFEFVNDFTTPLAKEKLAFTSKLTVFQAVYSTESDELKGLPEEDYWKYPDVNFENILTVHLTKYLIMNFYLQVLYDKEIDLAGRFKQTMSLGVTYKLL